MHTYEEKLHIAKQAYKAIRSTIDNVESHLDMDISTLWNGCILVEDEWFFECDLAEK